MKPGPTKTVKISESALRDLKIIAATRSQRLYEALDEVLKRERERLKP